jgi:hypothetical protein
VFSAAQSCGSCFLASTWTLDPQRIPERAFLMEDAREQVLNDLDPVGRRILGGQRAESAALPATQQWYLTLTLYVSAVSDRPTNTHLKQFAFLVVRVDPYAIEWLDRHQRRVPATRVAPHDSNPEVKSRLSSQSNAAPRIQDRVRSMMCVNVTL